MKYWRKPGPQHKNFILSLFAFVVLLFGALVLSVIELCTLCWFDGKQALDDFMNFTGLWNFL